MGYIIFNENVNQFCLQPPYVFCVGASLNKKQFLISLLFIITCCSVSKDKERQGGIVTFICCGKYQNYFRY